jgi:TolB-like protein
MDRTEPHPPPLIRLQGFTLDRLRSSVRLADGSEPSLRPKCFDLLWVLALNAGRILDKDRLLNAVWPGVNVTEDSLVQAMREVRRAIGDTDGRVLRTVPRRGYLLDAVPAAEAARRVPASDSLPVITVQPFQTAVGTAADTDFAEGLTEDIAIALSRSRALRVVLRPTAQAAPDQPAEGHAPHGTRGLRYRVLGRVRRAGGRLRIVAELAEAESGTVLWAESFEGEAADPAAQQHLVATSIVAALLPRIEQEEIGRAARTPAAELTAYDLYLQALRHYHATGAEAYLEAQRLLDAALQQDPEFHLARALLASVIWSSIAMTSEQEIAMLRERALAEVRLALAGDRHDAALMARCAWVVMLAGRDLQESAALLRVARAANPQSREASLVSAWHALVAGDPALAGRHLDELDRPAAMPIDAPLVSAARIAVLFFARRFTDALLAARTALIRGPGLPLSRVFCIAALAHAGEREEASLQAAALLSIQPHRTLRMTDQAMHFHDAAMRTLLLDGLRLAGIPD